MSAIYRCGECKFAGTTECKCRNGEWHHMGPKWRMPKKRNKRAWDRIANGEIWWDRKAIAKKARDESEKSRRYWDYLKLRKRNANSPRCDENSSHN